MPTAAASPPKMLAGRHQNGDSMALQPIGFFKDKTGGNTGAFLVLAGFGAGTAILCVALKYTTLSRTPTFHAPVIPVTPEIA